MFIQCPFKTLLTFVRAIFTNIFSRNYAILVLNIKKKKKNGTPSNFKHKQNPNFHHFSYHNSRVVIVFSISHFVSTSALISIPIMPPCRVKHSCFPSKSSHQIPGIQPLEPNSPGNPPRGHNFSLRNTKNVYGKKFGIFIDISCKINQTCLKSVIAGEVIFFFLPLPPSPRM